MIYCHVTFIYITYIGYILEYSPQIALEFSLVWDRKKGMEMQASSANLLSDVIRAHKNRGMFMVGKSQCEKKLAGEI